MLKAEAAGKINGAGVSMRAGSRKAVYVAPMGDDKWVLRLGDLCKFMKIRVPKPATPGSYMTGAMCLSKDDIVKKVCQYPVVYQIGATVTPVSFIQISKFVILIIYRQNQRRQQKFKLCPHSNRRRQ